MAVHELQVLLPAVIPIHRIIAGGPRVIVAVHRHHARPRTAGVAGHLHHQVITIGTSGIPISQGGAIVTHSVKRAEITITQRHRLRAEGQFILAAYDIDDIGTCYVILLVKGEVDIIEREINGLTGVQRQRSLNIKQGRDAARIILRDDGFMQGIRRQGGNKGERSSRVHADITGNSGRIELGNRSSHITHRLLVRRNHGERLVRIDGNAGISGAGGS